MNLVDKAALSVMKTTGTTKVSVHVLAFTFCLHFRDIFITTTIKGNLQLRLQLAIW